MLRLIVRRLVYAVPLIVIVSFAAFVMIDLAPGDAATSIAGDQATPEQIARVRENLGLDDPLVVRYGRWLGDAVHGDLGTSLVNDRTVARSLGDRAGITASLALLSMALATVIALLAGIGAALRPRGLLDRALSVFSALAVAAPPFWLGLIGVYLLAVDRSLLPAIGYTAFADGPWEWFRHLVLPSVALAAVPAAEMARQLRGSLVDVLDKDYIVTARAKGLAPRTIVGKHALKNASVPVVTVLGFRVAQLFGGTVVVEKVFNIQGIGSLVVDAVLQRDVPVVLGVVVTATAVVAVVNVLVDVLHGYLNPKVRPA